MAKDISEARVFIDTNVLIYAHDKSAGEKHNIAKNLLLSLWNAGNGVLSTQVLQEFFVATTKKLPSPMDIDLAKAIIKSFLVWDIVMNDESSILEAIEMHKRYKYSFWDALIIQAAIKGGAAILLSEDLADGQKIKGITIKNPFI